MKVKELIKFLKKFNPKSEIKIIAYRGQHILTLSFKSIEGEGGTDRDDSEKVWFFFNVKQNKL